jgi:phytanoyl-CoA hydroxylase
VRAELDRYIRDDLASKPLNARTSKRTRKPCATSGAWRNTTTFFRALGEREDIKALIAPLVHGEPVLVGVETFNKPARIGSGVPYHQDNAYFCQTPPDMLTVWIAIDAVTEANGPVFFVKGSHKAACSPPSPSGVRGNSIGMAETSHVPLSEQFCGLLEPGDATIHQCETIHHSAPNTTEHSRLGLLLVYRGTHTRKLIRSSKKPTPPLAATPPA